MLQDIKSLISSDNLTEALSQLDRHIAANPSDPEGYFLRGKVNWRLGKRSEAQNDYMSAVALDPDSPAKAALEYAREIEAFFNPDLLNP